MYNTFSDIARCISQVAQVAWVYKALCSKVGGHILLSLSLTIEGKMYSLMVCMVATSAKTEKSRS